MGVIGIEEIFLKTKNMEKALEFYNGILGIPIDKRDDEKTYLQMERGHLVLQIENHTGLHQGGGPLHFAMTVTEEAFDDGDCQKACCAANENTCCETDFYFVAGVAGGLFVLIAICVVVCCVECRRRRALGRVVRKRAAPPFEGERV